MFSPVLLILTSYPQAINIKNDTYQHRVIFLDNAAILIISFFIRGVVG